MNTSGFIRQVYSEDTGGGFVVDVLVLSDDTVLVIGEDSIVLYSNHDAWEDSSIDGQLGTIIREQKQVEL